MGCKEIMSAFEEVFHEIDRELSEFADVELIFVVSGESARGYLDTVGDYENEEFQAESFIRGTTLTILKQWFTVETPKEVETLVDVETIRHGTVRYKITDLIDENEDEYVFRVRKES
jgi:hypothetical protein